MRAIRDKGDLPEAQTSGPTSRAFVALPAKVVVLSHMSISLRRLAHPARSQALLQYDIVQYSM